MYSKSIDDDWGEVHYALDELEDIDLFSTEIDQEYSDYEYHRKLTPEEIEDACEKILTKNDSVAKETLIFSLIGLVKYIALKFHNGAIKHIVINKKKLWISEDWYMPDLEDLKSEGELILIQKINNLSWYNPQKGSFTGYIGETIKRRLYFYIQEHQAYIPVDDSSLENLIERTPQKAESSHIIMSVKQGLQKDEAEIFNIILEEDPDWIKLGKGNKNIIKILHPNEQLSEDQEEKELKRIIKIKKNILFKFKDSEYVNVHNCKNYIGKEASLEKFEALLSNYIVDYNRATLKEALINYIDSMKKKYSLNLGTSYITNGFLGINKNLPLRREILLLALYLKCDINVVDEFLSVSGCSGLYTRSPRDLAYIFALNNQYDINQYITLAKRIEGYISDETVQSKVMIKDIIARLHEYSSMENNLSGSLGSITKLVNSELNKLLSSTVTEDMFCEWVEERANLFTHMRQRTYRVFMKNLLDYVSQSDKWFINTYGCLSPTSPKDLPLEDRSIKLAPLFRQVEAFSGYFLEEDTKKNLLKQVKTNIDSFMGIKNNPFDFNRDTFLALLVFLKQHKTYSLDEFIDEVNRELEDCEYEPLDKNHHLDQKIIQLFLSKKRGEYDDDSDGKYSFFFTSVCGISGNYKNSQYTYL